MKRPVSATSWQRAALWCLAPLALFSMPVLVSMPAAGIDPSWELGLHMARDRGLTVGRDLIFNYGPWGFLNIPIALTHGS